MQKTKTIIGTHSKTMIDEIVLCDFPHTLIKLNAKYNARIKAAGGAWAYVCQYHFDFFHCELGLGKGQELILKKKGGEKI